VAALFLALVSASPWCRGRPLGFPILGLAFGLIGLGATATLFQTPVSPDHVRGWVNRPGLVFGGLVAETPRVVEDRTRLLIEADEAGPVGGPLGPVRGQIQVTVPGRVRAAMGDRVRFPALLRPIHGFHNPGGFDYGQYMARQGVWVRASLESRFLLAVRNDHGTSLQSWLGRVRARAADFLDHHASQPAVGLIKALLLGLQGEVEPDVRDNFRRLGLSHLLSISGLHVGLVALAAYWLARRLLGLSSFLTLRFNLRRVAAVLSLAPVLFYAGLAGGRPATVRAAIMVSVFLLATLLERKKDHLTALAAAAWIILIVQPGSLFTASFQLSFLATAFIILAAERWLIRPRDQAGPKHPVRTRILGLTLTPAAAMAGTSPVVAWHFNRLPWLSLPANVIFTPLISLGVVPPGLAALAMATVWPTGAGYLIMAMERLLWLVLADLEILASQPWLEVLAPRPGFMFLTVWYLGCGVVLLIRPWKKALVAVTAMGGLYLLCTVVPGLWNKDHQTMSVTFLDVGQGNAAHVRFPDGADMVVDAGGFPRSDFDTGADVVAPYLLSQGVRRVEILAVSHPQTDHGGGMPFLAEYFDPLELWTNGVLTSAEWHQRLLNLADTGNLAQPGPARLSAGRRFGPALVQCLAPGPDFRPDLGQSGASRDLNNTSLVLKLQLGRISFLLPGDLEKEGEAALVWRRAGDLQADVLLACHHGSAGSLTPAFLAAVRPRYVVFSVGPGNRFGFPAPETLKRAAGAGAQLFRTDLDGAVTFTTDGKQLSVETCR
jgi:competence protein ComEC